MEFVLDHEIGRRKRRRQARALPRFRSPVQSCCVVAVAATEQRPGLPDPWQRRELVHRCDQEGGEPPVDWLVYRYDGKGAVARKVAFEVRTNDAQLARLVVIGQEREGIGTEARSAPRAVFER